MPTKTSIQVFSLCLLGALVFSVPALAQTQEALQFNSASSQYVTFGNSGTLGAKTFTIEVRFKRTGAGVATSTGSGGVSGIPLLAKGRAEADGSNLDCNYFLGIDGTTGRLVADFEDTTASNNNHPVSGTTVIQNDIWYHAAATFDGTNFRIYLNGNLEGSVTSAAKPRYDSIQHASLASALTSSGAASGFFTGILDEARIWNIERSQSQLQTDMDLEVLSGTGLIARWGLNEGTGTTAGNSVAGSVNGTLTNAPLWTTDSPLSLSTAAGLRFGGTNAYVTFGNAAALGLATFTIETWFRRDGAGATTSTGAITGVPLVTKGRGEADGSNVDCNYFLGIDGATGKLAADFEDFTASNNNHPLLGTTVITNGTWYHAAATFDGSAFKLYLNGNLEGSLSTSAVPRYDSIQHAGFASAMTSTGAAAGFLNGAMDEVRIWNMARSQSDIIAAMNAAITGPMSGLVARWGLDEDALTTVASSAGTAVNGTIMGSNWAWAAGSPMNAVPPGLPADPTSLNASAVSYSQVDANWVDNATNETGYELERSTNGAAGPYTLLITLPANTSSYSNTGLNASSEYCYRVRAVNGTGGSNYAGPACATTMPLLPPADPSDLALTAPTYGQVDVSWTDHATDETGYELERSTSGSAGPFALIATLPVNAAAYDDLNRDAGTEYCYRVRAVRNTDVSGYAGPECVTTSPASSTALSFGSAGNTYATLGGPADLQLSNFTLELWFRRDGAGVGTNTGTGGIPDLIPLIAKGRAETEDPLKDINYILGIRASDGVLCADFEEAAGTPNPSLNHPIAGTTSIVTGVWHHAAATYDGTIWNLYLDGVLEASLNVGRPVASASTVTVAIASALSSTNVASGYFDGAVDEVRFWNIARTLSQIRSNANSPLSTPAPNLVGRWSLDEGSGTTLNGSSGTTINGAVLNSDYTWLSPGAPFNLTFTHILTTTGDPQEGGQITRNPDLPSYSEGSSVLLTAVAVAGYHFTNWSGDLTGITNPESLVMDTDKNVTAHFAPDLNALAFSGNTYVTFGDPAVLDLAQFTIECWFRRDGTGTTVSTGSGGVTDAIPLVTHGTSQSDGSNVDENFFLGIRDSDGVLCADFEEGAAGASPGLNHPVTGVTPVGMSQWHHAAVTYDGAAWNLYLDGNLERTLVVGQPPRSDTIQHAALGSSITSTGTAQGYFNGALDEVRVWNFARSAGQIQADANTELTAPQTGLVARWALDEGSGAAVNSSAGTSVNGTITGTNFAWIAPAPFNLTFTPPAAPSGLETTAVSANEIDLSWTDNAGNESAFQIERSTTGVSGTYTFLATVPANAASYPDATAAPETEYCYRVRAVNSFGSSAYADAACDITPAPGNTGLDLAGNTYVGFGNPSALSLTAFTIETWLRRDGPGVGTNTGSGGIPDAIPLVTKGRAESETATTDINYFFGIRASDGVLCADFEEGAGGASPSLNHPVTGTTPIEIGGWHHVAATYDGVSFKLYLDGMLNGSLDPEQPLASASTVAVALGSALNSADVASGFFDGALDEVRIWNVARTEAELQSTANIQISVPTAGLVARWSLDEGTGTAVHGSAGTSISGTVNGAAYTWVSGAPFNLTFNHAPLSPVLAGPANNQDGVNTGATLSVNVADPDTETVTVRFYGRPATSTPGPDFTIIGLPDTQYYTSELNGGTNAMFQSQTNWIVANRASRNIVYVTQLGDCTEHGDNSGNDIEWQRAQTALEIIENPITTGLPDGIPYGICVGNHDQSPIGNPEGTTTFYNQYFGVNRFSGRNYYGGHYGVNNDNWYDLFSAAGMDFIAVSFEYNTSPDAAVLTWADNLLTAYSDRRAIVMSHFICNTGNPGTFGSQGQAIYNALKAHSNLFLMLCGHVPGEGRRQDTFNGNTVYTLLSDYQGRTNGGNGWLRIMEFSPASNVIRVKTYSPWLDQYEADADSSSQFTLPYNMSSSQPFTLLGTLSEVPSGSTVDFPWPALSTSTPYEWYVTVTDSAATVTGPIWRFTTRSTHTITASASRGGEIDPAGEVAVTPGADRTFTMTAESGYTLANLMVDGVAVGASSTYTFPGVNANHTIQAVFASPTGIGDGVPSAFVFGGVSPNPAHRLTRLRFGLPRSAHVSLDVYDVNGRRVAKVANRTFEPGYHELTWAGTGEMGSVPSGIYFMRFMAGKTVMTRRFVLIR